MFPDSPYATSVGSFQRPVSPPGVAPDQSPFIYVAFNQAWLAYVMGSIKQLLLQATWKVSNPSELDTVQGQAFTLLYLFSEFIDTAPKLGSAGASEELMIRQNPDNPCLLQSSVDGVNWCTFADISLCIPAVGQQAPGQPQPNPGGGSHTYCNELLGNGKVLLPTIVNSGDQIQLISASGQAWDGGTVLWSCFDGSESFVDCIPGSGSPIGGADPMPTENHMSLIANIGGTFYSLIHGPFTVPGGVSNAPVTLQVNDSDLTNNTGSFQVCVKVTNNQPLTWIHVFDLTVSNSGWVEGLGFTNPIWVPGTGWTAGDDNDGGSGASFRRLAIKRTFAPTNITKVEFLFNYVYGTAIVSTNLAYRVRWGLSGSFTNLESDDFAHKPSNGNHDLLYPVGTSADTIDIYLATDDQATLGFSPTGHATLTKVIVTGTGSDPF